jgi:hypothetical protein
MHTYTYCMYKGLSELVIGLITTLFRDWTISLTHHLSGPQRIRMSKEQINRAAFLADFTSPRLAFRALR